MSKKTDLDLIAKRAIEFPSYSEIPTEKEQMTQELRDLRSQVRDLEDKLEIKAIQHTNHIKEQRVQAAMKKLKSSVSYNILLVLSAALVKIDAIRTVLESAVTNKMLQMVTKVNDLYKE